MRIRKPHIPLLAFIVAYILLDAYSASARAPGIRGQVSAWTLANLDRLDESQAGLRYIPELSVSFPLSETWALDGQYSLNVYGLGRFEGWDRFRTDGDLKSYRAWLRLASNQFEARLGLQKINFGSAAMLRPLMWFDRIDPRDPLQITDGVWGFLMRYFFLNNTNLWFWALYGNDDTKGWEFIPTQEKTVELGGRIQVPVPLGEMGFSYHHRRIDVDKGVNQLLAMMGLGDGIIPGQPALSGFGKTPENRYGLDGKWDIGVGLWTEAVLIHHRFGQPIQYINLPTPEYQRLIDLGLDYTFGLGNGLYAVFEQFWFDITQEAFGEGESVAFSSLSLSYPIGLLDNLTGMVFYDWENQDWYRFLNWQRTFDAWSLYIMAFWNPDQFQLYQGISGSSLFSGKGFQFMAVFNH